MNRLNELFNATTRIMGFHVVGWVDLHYPCDGHIKAQVRIGLPPQRAAALEWTDMRDAVEAIFAALGVPHDETYEAHFCGAEHQKSTAQPRDRHGMSDRL
jgi:hypothetical protein